VELEALQQSLVEAVAERVTVVMARIATIQIQERQLAADKATEVKF
jgi:hypothetical protein